MDEPRLVQLALKRQRLQLLAATQRLELRQQATVFAPAFEIVDRLRAGVDYLKRRPEWLVFAVVTLVVARPRRAFPWLRRGFVAWQLYRRLRRHAASLLAAKPLP